jgi:predicted dehydrogenase
MNLSPEERAVGRENYFSAVTRYDEVHRRDFLKQAMAASTVAAGGLGAMYFGYHRPQRPVRIGIIGTGDEGNVLIGALNPEYVQVMAIADIRPSSIHRALHGDYSSPSALAARPGLMSVYGWKSRQEAESNVRIFQDYHELLAMPEIEGVIIALPLHLHAIATVEAMKAGKHVLCEKLMGHNIVQCKLMGQMADASRRFLSIGHQRHYSVLYDNAVHLLSWGLLGELHHIRAQWHRGNLPGQDSWAPPIPGGQQTSSGGKVVDLIRDQLAGLRRELGSPGISGSRADWLRHQIAQWEQWDRDQDVAAEKWGYENDASIAGGNQVRTALEELVRWRLWNRTGGGLMAELGSHQLDAAGIFVSAVSRQTGKKIHPLSVHATGGRHLFPSDRDCEDHVYCMFEYPGPGYDYAFPVGYRDPVLQYPPPTGIPGYDQDPQKKIVVTYSSINGNGFGGYGEVVMGTRGTLALMSESEVLLYKDANTRTKAGVTVNRSGQPILDTTASGDAAPAQAAQGSGPPSRGYREEIEHWAFCIRENNWDIQPRCNGPVALGDAVVALATRLAIRNGQQPGGHGFLQFQPEWFDLRHPAVPEAATSESARQQWDLESRALGLPAAPIN